MTRELDTGVLIGEYRKVLEMLLVCPSKDFTFLRATAQSALFQPALCRLTLARCGDT